MADAIDVGALFDRYGDAVRRLCRRLTGNDADAQDAAQEAFLQLQRHAERLDPGGNPLGWLFRTAANAALKLRRRRLAPLPPEDAAECGPVESVVDAGEIHRAIDSLPPEDREILSARFREGIPPAAIAARLGIQAGAVRTRLCRALQTLRLRLRRNA